MFRADLHCHTTCSDGSYTPIELIALAKEEGLQGLSITDHDTIDAYEMAIPAAKQAGILLGTGVEFSCDFKGSSVHVLGYDYPVNSQEIRAFCEMHARRRQRRNRTILEKLARLRMPIAEEELNQVGRKTIGRPHIAQAMIEKGYVKTLKEAFQLYIGEGRPCYDPGEPFPVQETLNLIHQVGGKAFLAHPHLAASSKLIRELLTLNFNGIECYYAKCTPEQERRWLKVAQKQGLLVSGGSDFHGTLKPHIPLGSSWVTEEIFHTIFQNT